MRVRRPWKEGRGRGKACWELSLMALRKLVLEGSDPLLWGVCVREGWRGRQAGRDGTCQRLSCLFPAAGGCKRSVMECLSPPRSSPASLLPDECPFFSWAESPHQLPAPPGVSGPVFVSGLGGVGQGAGVCFGSCEPMAASVGEAGHPRIWRGPTTTAAAS